MARLNPADVCRLPSNIEGALKEQLVSSFRRSPGDRSAWNRRLTKSFEEYKAGLFGAAAMDMLDSLEEDFLASRSVNAPNAELYPALANALPTNANSFVGKLLGVAPTRDQYVEALKNFHRDMKNAEEAVNADEDDLETDEAAEARDGRDADAVASKADEWFNDEVDSPSEAQIIPLAGYLYSKRSVVEQVCDEITRTVDSIKDWGDLDIEGLNGVRELLVNKMNMLIFRKSLDNGAENYERLNSVYACLSGSIPYIRPNQNAGQVESVCYRTMMAMDAALRESLEDDSSLAAREYTASLSFARILHENSSGEVETLKAVFSEVDAIATACALIIRQIGAVGSGNSAFYSSVVSTARENALANIAEGRRAGIPCVMPAFYFQQAESTRDAYSPDDDPEVNRLAVFQNYLHASLSAKALVLCFAGRKPELNAKGYCSKSTAYEVFDSDSSAFTVRYLGVDGEPILRDGFSGYRTALSDGVRYTSWLDLGGRAVRTKSSNECWTTVYDASDRRTRKTYCNTAWEPAPRKDGVLFETFGYDAEGNRISWEFFGASSNHVLCADSVAVIKSWFNKRGQELRRRFYGVKGEPVLHKDGDAGFDVVYDKRGNQRKFIYVDCKGLPVMMSLGYASEEWKYDAQNREIEHAWYDEKGKPACVGGVAKVQSEYDERGNRTSLANIGADGRLTRDDRNVSVACWTYNQADEAVECRYYGPDGEPTLHRDGNASWTTVFDASGRCVGRKYYDLKGNEVDLGRK